jgi:2-hydroxy-6-oxonona-2,4-dienedioate hydrolase
MTIWTDLLGQEVAQKFYDVKGIRTRVIEAGRGEPLIFLHGTGGHAEAYTRNIAAHAAHFRVMSVDMVGHGFSDAPDIEYSIDVWVKHLGDLIETLGAKQVCLSGESLGGMVSAWYAIRNPGRVRKLVLNTGMLMQRDEAGRAQLRDAMERSKRASGQLTRETIRGRLAWLMAEPEKSVTEELVETRYRIYSQPGRAAILGRISAHMFGGLLDDAWSERWSNAEAMREIRCPTLVIWSRHNPGLTSERAALGKDKIPDARMVVLEKSAHWPQWEEAEEFNRIHLDFLRS